MENEIEIRDTINLSDGKEYAVCSKVLYQEKYYLYLIDINDIQNIKFCEELKENGVHKVIELESATLVKTLLPLFYEAGKHIIEEFNQE